MLVLFFGKLLACRVGKCVIALHQWYLPFFVHYHVITLASARYLISIIMDFEVSNFKPAFTEKKGYKEIILSFFKQQLI